MARAVSSVGINTGTKSSCGRKGLFVRHTVPHHCPSLRGVRTGTQTGQAHGGGNRCRSPEGVLLTDSLVMACLLISSRVAPTMCGMGPTTSIINSENSPSADFLFQNDFSLCQVDMKTGQSKLEPSALCLYTELTP